MAYGLEQKLIVQFFLKKLTFAHTKQKRGKITQFGQGYFRKSSEEGRFELPIHRGTGYGYHSKAGGGGKDRFQKRYRLTGL